MPTKLNNHQNLNNKHKFRKCMVPISNSFVGFKAHSLRALAPLGIFALFLANVTVCNVSALSISVSSDALSLDLVSGKYGHSEVATIEILSDDALAGYTLTLSGSETLNASKTENGVLNKITNETWTDENEFENNTWGLKYCNLADNSDCINATTYTQPTENLQIDKTSVNNSQTVKYALSIGAKTSESINADTYSNTFTLAATPNPVYHSVGFVDWTENMPDAIAGTGTSIKMPTNIPIKTGYTFAGWCKTKPTNNGTTCNDFAEADASGNYALTTTDGVAYTNLYATWMPKVTFEKAFESFQKNKVEVKDAEDNVIGEYYSMQDMNSGICSAVSIAGEASVIQLVDERDNNIYSVGKLADGKCWLLDNLRLTGEAGDLSSGNTNVPENWDKPTSEGGLGGFGFDTNPYRLPDSGLNTFANNPSGYEVAGINTDSLGHHKENDEIEAAGDWDYGVYYNYAAVSAGAIRTSPYEPMATYSVLQYDICPKGWRVPTGGPEGEYQGLHMALGGDYLTSGRYGYRERLAFRRAVHLPLSGRAWNNTVTLNNNVSVYVWSSTMTRYNGAAYLLYLNTEGIATQEEMLRHGGFAVRCIAK